MQPEPLPVLASNPALVDEKPSKVVELGKNEPTLHGGPGKRPVRLKVNAAPPEVGVGPPPTPRDTPGRPPSTPPPQATPASPPWAPPRSPPGVDRGDRHPLVLGHHPPEELGKLPPRLPSFDPPLRDNPVRVEEEGQRVRHPEGGLRAERGLCAIGAPTTTVLSPMMVQAGGPASRTRSSPRATASPWLSRRRRTAS